MVFGIWYLRGLHALPITHYASPINPSFQNWLRMKRKNNIIICKYLPNHIAAISLFPFILCKNASYAADPIVINHERIHLKQQLELLILLFYLWYGIEFLLRFAYLKDAQKAYRALSFEREAYTHESDLLYLKTRTCYSFWGKW